MDTESIRLFVLAAEKLNISAAGRQLGLAPAVASARLSKLEYQLETELLHRTTRKVALSLEGEEFLPYAREILAQEDTARAALGHRSAEVKGTLRFAASSTFAQQYVTPHIPEFLDRFPNVNLELKLSDTQADLIEGAFDLALRASAVEDTSFRGRKLADDTRVLYASPDYLKVYGMPQTPEDLIEHRLLVFMNEKPRVMVNANGSPSTFPPPLAKARVVCDDGANMRAAALAGVGVCMSSLWSISQELQDGRLVRVLPDYVVDAGSAIWLAYPKSNVLTVKVRVFIDYLVEKIGSPPVWQVDDGN